MGDICRRLCHPCHDHEAAALGEAPRPQPHREEFLSTVKIGPLAGTRTHRGLPCAIMVAGLRGPRLRNAEGCPRPRVGSRSSRSRSSRRLYRWSHSGSAIRLATTFSACLVQGSSPPFVELRRRLIHHAPLRGRARSVCRWPFGLLDRERIRRVQSKHGSLGSSNIP